MKNPHEHFYISELPEFSAKTLRADTGHIDLSALEGAHRTRVRMLQDIEQDIAPDFLQAIRSKIAYEERALASLLEAEVHTDRKKRERHGVLRSEYFIRRPLPPNHF